MSLQMAITLLERDTSQISLRAVRSNERQLLAPIIAKSNYLEFTRAGLPNPDSVEKRSTLKRIAFLCENNQLIRRSWSVLDAPLRENYKDKVLLNHVAQCKLAYLNASLQVLSQWRANLLPSIQSDTSTTTEVIPKAVQLNLKLTDWGKASFLFILPEGLYASV